ncbi:MAG: hypothetical protein WC733_05170, partial [Methylophilus sp.]|jgi:hypothetical protein
LQNDSYRRALLALIIVAASGSASAGGKAASSASNATLPEIMPYDEVAVDPLPEFIPAEL